MSHTPHGPSAVSQATLTAIKEQIQLTLNRVIQLESKTEETQFGYIKVGRE